MIEAKGSALAERTSSPAGRGDLGAAIAYFMDGGLTLFVLGTMLSGVYRFPADVVFSRIVPGAAIGIVVGNVLLTLLARRLASREGRDDVTAIPLGVDMISVVAMVFFVLGPVYSANVQAMGEHAAAMLAWKAGVGVTLWAGFIKLAFAPFARAIIRHIPMMALFGSMASLVTVWLGSDAMLDVLARPEIGLMVMTVMLIALIAGHRLPFGAPGALAAVLFGTCAYYALAAVGGVPGYSFPVLPLPALSPPMPTSAGLETVFGPAFPLVGVILPLAVFVTITAINVAAGSIAMGDNVDARAIVAADAVATLASALFGNVAQTTPYFGHATYKRAGGRLNYSLMAVGAVALLACSGAVMIAAAAIPDAVLKTILVVVAADILRITFSRGEARHAPALLFALVPAVVNFACVKVSDLLGRIQSALVAGGVDAHTLAGADWHARFAIMTALANGYVLTSLVWGAIVVWTIDGHMRRASGAAAIAAALTLFGLMHSVLPSSEIYFPWRLPMPHAAEALPYRFAAGYAGMAVVLFLCARPARVRQQAPVEALVSNGQV